MNGSRTVRAIAVLTLVSIAAIAMSAPAAHAERLSRDKVPEPLKPWVDWALHGERDSLCPFLAGQEGSSRCAWPGRLDLVLDESGGRFTQTWEVVVESRIPLPGEKGRWPEDVKLDNAPVVPLAEDASPSLRVAAGNHVISGAFRWDSLPDSLAVDSATGLVALTVRGASIAFPNRGADGRVWLGRAAAAPAEEERASVRVNRRVSDDVPLTLSTRIDLSISGKAREIRLGPALPADFTPLSLGSPLAARLEPDGKLRVQVRPGQWQIDLVARHVGPAASLALPQPGELWAEGGEEVWVWDARPALRVVEVEGVTAVDPQQTTLPEDWKRLPAYRMAPGVEMKLTEQRRGNDPPEPDRLTLERTWWLDFDGGGYTVRDAMQGTLSKSFRLEMAAPTKLGRVTLGGRDQVITRRPGADEDGVEVRQGQVELAAESRIQGGARTIPAVSWDADVESLSATLNLPPGWRVLAARGADQVPGTWVEEWTLLDFFLVLIAALAFRRLWGWLWGGLALAGMVLVHPEAHGFAWLFLAVLLGEGALRLLKEGKARRVVGVLWLVGVGYTILAAVPFLVWQVRLAMYPALEYPFPNQHYTAPANPVAAQFEGAREREVSLHSLPATPEAAPIPQEMANQVQVGAHQDALLDAERRSDSEIHNALDSGGDESQEIRAQISQKVEPKYRTVGAPPDGFRPDFLQAHTISSPDDLQKLDPKAIVSTGPGLPTWSWNSINLTWSGPVQRAQEVRLYLLSPFVNALLNVARAALLALLVLRLMNFPGSRWPVWLKGAQAAPVAAATLVLLSLVFSRSASASDIPNQPLLTELKDRLTERPDCYPNCASFARSHFDASAARLAIRLEVVALADTAVPLPGSAETWVPTQALVDGKPAPTVRSGSGLWALISSGSKEILLDGPLPERDEVAIPLPLLPTRVETAASGWTIEGVHENGQPDASLTLRRVRTTPANPDEINPDSPQVLPSFLSVTRTLRLGLTWEIVTDVRRLSPAGTPVTAQIPLLAGESVTTEDVRVENGCVLMNLAPDAAYASWTSKLDQKPTLELAAATSAEFVERWVLDASTLWHVEPAGFPPIHPGQSGGVRAPVWQPWPGEKLTLAITRPEGVPGATLTIDQSQLAVTPGLRSSDATLTLTIRSSRGGRHAVTLPEGAELTSVKVGGLVQPLRQEGSRVTLPINPGSQEAEVSWREPRGIGARFTTPVVDIGAASVNATTVIQSSSNRWVLFVRGPRLGPAVLFWSLLAVLLAISIGLGRVPFTPLRAHHWFLLGLGLTQLPVQGPAIVASWLLALGFRRAHVERLGSRGTFNLVQVLLAMLTVAALTVLFFGIKDGLLGMPEMQISGNGSLASELKWFSDRAESALPRAWMISVPLWVYRVAMLAWALWIAASLIRWLRWGWDSFTTGGGWKAAPPKPEKRPMSPPAWTAPKAAVEPAPSTSPPGA